VTLWGRVRSSLALALTGRIFAFVSLIILGVVGYLLFHEQQVLERELMRRGLLAATHLAQQSLDPILREDDYALFKLIQLLRTGGRGDPAFEERILYALVLDRHGQALAHTDPGRVHTLLDDSRTREALAHPVPSAVLASTESGEPVYDVAVPILMRGLPIGAVRLGISRAGVLRLIRDLAAKVLSVLFALMLIGIGSIWHFSHRMARPIRELRDSAQAVQAGDLTRRVTADRPDEIGELAAAFNAMTEKLAHSRSLLLQKEELRARLLEQVITAQEDERKRISRELHDETSQALTSLMVGLKVLECRADLAPAREALADLRALSGKTLDTVHTLALQLRPSVLDDLGLVPAVERLAADFQRTHGLPITLETNLRTRPRLPATAETTLYRIAQEALTNVARHAAARSVSVVLEARRGSVTLIVEDDGRGFDPARLITERNERSLGIFGMRERATLLGGSLTLESSPGDGTSVFVEIPLPDGQAHAASTDPGCTAPDSHTRQEGGAG
jgi:signal transduction histidine kinase